MEWVVAIGALAAGLTLRHVMLYFLHRSRGRHPHGLLARYVGRKWATVIVVVLCAAWYFSGYQSSSSATLTPSALAADLRSGQALPRQVGVQVKLERVDAVDNKVIVAHLVDVDDPGELPAIMANISQWDSSGLCDNLMLRRTKRAGIELVARFRARDAVSYRSIALTPETCGR